MTDDLNELDARIAKFKQSLAEDGVLAKDWAKWDAEHPYTPVQSSEPYKHEDSQAHHDALYTAAQSIKADQKGSGVSRDDKIDLRHAAANAYNASAQQALDHGDLDNAQLAARMATKYQDHAAKLEDAKRGG